MKRTALVLALFVTACAYTMPRGALLPPMEQAFTAQEAVAVFDDAVFHAEGFGGPKTTLNRWEKSIKISVFEEYAENPFGDLGDLSAVTRTSLSYLPVLTGRDVVFLPANDPASDLKIHVVNAVGYWPPGARRDRGARWGCGFLADWSEGGITRADAYINLADLRSSAEVVGCVVEETVQSLGVIGETRRTEVSVFNDTGPHGWLNITPLDGLILEVLYDPRLKVGMDRSTGLPIAAQIIEEKMLAKGRAVSKN